MRKCSASKGKELLKAIGKDEDDISSVLLIEGSKLNFYEKSDCVLQVIKSLGLPAQLATNIAKNLLPRPSPLPSIAAVLALALATCPPLHCP